MGKRALENKIKKLQELEQHKKEIEKKIEDLKMEIKTDMEKKGTEELKTED